MTLKTKYFIWTVILLLGVMSLGALSVWNLSTYRRAARATEGEYDAMDRADAAATQAAWLRDAMRGPDGATYRDPRFTTQIRADLDAVVARFRVAADYEDGDGGRELALAVAASQRLDAAAAQAANAGGGQASLLAASAALDDVRGSLLSAGRLVPESTRRQIAGASDRLLARIEWTCFWLFVVLVLSIAIHTAQYRALVRPLLVLRTNLRASAAREFRDEIAPPSRDAEYRDVAAAFNGLARELAELYRTLEAKVVARSRELVRSERLASVGFLAAGVAHEINNPLTVIAGYAEIAGKSLADVMNSDGTTGGTEAEAAALAEALDAQRLIHDEAFRCKEITGRLLSLSRGGGQDSREALRLDELARQVATLTKGLKHYRDRRVHVDLDPTVPLEVLANATEMKQVLLNLTVNALEAVAGERGVVSITGGRAGERWVELTVGDNGKGMTRETLANVFEPFFTNKRGVGEPGTGLGLSITHAIVESHGGTIRAESDGPGRGSRFTVRLPARPSGTAAVRVLAGELPA